MATYIDLDKMQPVVFAGEDLFIPIHVVDDAGADVNITGWTFGAWLRDELVPANLITVPSNSFTITSATGGLANFSLARATTLSIGDARYKIGIWRTDSGSQDDMAEGTIIFKSSARPAV